MAFHEVQFPVDISRGAQGGPQRRTQIVTLASGREERNSAWADSRRRYDAGYGIRHLDDIHAVLEFYEERRGMLHGFRWKDWADFRSGPPRQAVTALDQVIGQGDGAATAFQLIKTYGLAFAPWARVIAKPVAGTITVAIDGVVQGAGWSVDTATGIVSFTVAPGAGLSVTAGFDFDVPARFDSDDLFTALDTAASGDIAAIPIVEVRL